ncbi:protein kinase, partial [Streptomyces sp. NPDC049577]|uniref:protein kinase n=1 Tax=Streptomyces sp. NPDC049577 TaxID=3155153 RepID=UPI003440835B
MDDYAGRVLADRYRLPLPPSDAFELVETRALDTYSGHEVQIRQIPLPETVDAEVVGADVAGVDGTGGVRGAGGIPGARARAGGTGVAGSGDPAVRRALVAATEAARLPDHPRLDQVFHVFAEAGSLWIVSELVSARPLAALLAERPLSPHRAAEVAADVLTALRALHAQGWTHRNITARTVLVCDDGRAILTGLAAGAAEEALCGYHPVPEAPPGAAGRPVGAALPAQGGPSDGEGSAGRAVRAGARTADLLVDGAAQQGGSRPAPVGGSPGWGGPVSALDAERARQARMLVVGAVTERWAPEQAWPVQENWQLAPPVGPAADLWALGALLFRVVQGHAPYPEDSTADLVQLVCSQPPAYAEECGALRPVVESLMRKDPTERPDFEELRGWLRSLIRSAPEPDIGSRTVTVPSLGPGSPGDPRRLPAIRRRGELVRR